MEFKSPMTEFRNFLFKAYRKLTFGEFSIGEIDVVSDLAYLDFLVTKYRLDSGPLNDGLLRSFLQFKCQMHRLGRGREILLHLLSVPFVFVLLGFFLLGSFRKTKCWGGQSKAFLLPGVREDLLPASLSREYEIQSGSVGMGSSRPAMVFFLKAIFRFPLSFYFLLKVGHRIAQYQSVLNGRDVDAIIGTSEYSFSSSAATAFLSGLGKKHLNVMHGEKLLFIRDAFVWYERFFVWDDHYRSLFERMKSPSGQFVVELPPSLAKDIGERTNSNNENHGRQKFVYYLANESSEDLKNIAEAGRRLALARGIDFTVRPHPRYSDENLVRLHFRSDEVERGLSLNESLKQANLVCSVYSTVLFEAHLLSKTIVIDDVTSPRKFEALKSLGYVMISKKHSLLSDLLAQTGVSIAERSLKSSLDHGDEK